MVMVCAALSGRQGRRGAQDTLWAQNLRPLLDGREMGVGPGGAAGLVRSDRLLSCGCRRAFGEAPGTGLRGEAVPQAVTSVRHPG